MGKKWVTDIGLCVLVLAIMAGCAPARFRANPQLQEKVHSIKMVAIMPPSITFYQLTAGGDAQLMDEPPDTAKQIVTSAIKTELRRHADIVFKPFPSPSAVLHTSSELPAAEIRAELEDTQALFDAVSAEVLLHTYWNDPDQTFPEKLKNFDYSLGPDVQRLAKLADADAFLFTSGVDYISTGGRKALIGLSALASLLAAAGGMGVVGVFAAPAVVSVGLVDATTGDLLWYNVHVRPGHSLTDPALVAGLTAWIFEGFPGKWKLREEDDRSGSPRLGGALQ